MLVAEGAVDGAIEAVGVKAWDIAAIQPIVEEAGGRLTDFHGARRIDVGTAVVSNGLLHDALLASLSGLQRSHEGGLTSV
jgi:histidinol-phosphatase